MGKYIGYRKSRIRINPYGKDRYEMVLYILYV